MNSSEVFDFYDDLPFDIYHKSFQPGSTHIGFQYLGPYLNDGLKCMVHVGAFRACPTFAS